MADVDISTIATKLNARASRHPIGKLQDIRQELKHLRRCPGTDIFRIGSRTVVSNWACHYGGRTELQFNIGKDGSGGTMLRHGVAFSFETNQTLPAIDKLKPKVRLFNDFLRLHPDTYASMRMWHFERDVRSDEYMPAPIPPERVKEGVFLFLGRRRAIEHLDYELILDDFDSLLPLYRYVESAGEAQPIQMPVDEAFSFSPGCSEKATATRSSPAQSDIDVTLRHNEMQGILCRRLVLQFGADHVRDECPCAGMRVDVVVRRPKGYWLYEIKTAHSPRACIREAVGQLLEYAFWPRGCNEASRLIVIGESPLDHDGMRYLEQIRARFALPIYYEQVIV